MRVVDVADGVSVVVHLLHCVGVPDDYLGHQYLDFSSAFQADFPALLPQLSGSEYGGRHGAWLGPLHQVAVGLAVPVGDEPCPRPGDSVRCVSTRRTAHHLSEFLFDFWWTPSLVVYLWYIATMSWLPDTSWTEPSPPGAIRTPSSTFGPSGIWWASCR